MAGVDELVKDPDFVKLDPARQKQVLLGVDPDFQKLSDAQITQFLQGVTAPVALVAKPVPPPNTTIDRFGALGTEAGDVMPGGWGTTSRAFSKVGELSEKMGPGQAYRGLLELHGERTKPGRWEGAEAYGEDKSPGYVQRGVSDIVEGVGKALMVKYLPEVVSTPVRTGLSYAAGTLASWLGEGTSRRMGAGKDTQRMMGDLSGWVAGVGLYRTFPELMNAPPEQARAFRSAILKAGWKNLSLDVPKMAKGIMTDPEVVAAWKAIMAHFAKPTPSAPPPTGMTVGAGGGASTAARTPTYGPQQQPAATTTRPETVVPAPAQPELPRTGKEGLQSGTGPIPPPATAAATTTRPETVVPAPAGETPAELPGWTGGATARAGAPAAAAGGRVPAPASTGLGQMPVGPPAPGEFGRTASTREPEALTGERAAPPAEGERVPASTTELVTGQRLPETPAEKPPASVEPQKGAGEGPEIETKEDRSDYGKDRLPGEDEASYAQRYMRSWGRDRFREMNQQPSDPKNPNSPRVTGLWLRDKTAGGGLAWLEKKYQSNQMARWVMRAAAGIEKDSNILRHIWSERTPEAGPGIKTAQDILNLDDAQTKKLVEDAGYDPDSSTDSRSMESQRKSLAAEWKWRYENQNHPWPDAEHLPPRRRGSKGGRNPPQPFAPFDKKVPPPGPVSPPSTPAGAAAATTAATPATPTLEQARELFSRYAATQDPAAAQGLLDMARALGADVKTPEEAAVALQNRLGAGRGGASGAGRSQSQIFQERADAALENIRRSVRDIASGRRFNIPGDMFADAVTYGVNKLAQGTVDFVQWSKDMLGELGDWIKPHLGDLYAKAKQALADERGAIKISKPGAKEAGPEQREPKGPPSKEKDVKARSIETLYQRIPPEMRAVAKDPTKTIDGRQFHDLDLDAPGEGFLPWVRYGPERAQQMVERAFEESIQESEMEGGTAARDAVKKTGMRPPTAGFWHKALSQPLRTRYWYELSGESFTGKDIDIPRELHPRVIDLVAATSNMAEPYDNMQRTLGTLAEDLQSEPVMTDLINIVPPRTALGPAPLRSLKFRSFSGTMQYTTGLSPEPTLSTNDRQVASYFSVTGDDIAKNPVLYEVLSRFHIKMRDMQNALSASGAQPWEAWQLQAPAWVYERALKNPAKASEYDDYSLVLPRITQKLANAGIPTPGGKITMETLMNPRVASVLSGTRERFMATPIATVETATEHTAAGAEAAALYRQLGTLDPDLPWVREAKGQYEQKQRNMMKALGTKQKGEDSLVAQLMSEIVGRNLDVSRIDFNGYGTYQREINPNMRIPLAGKAGKDWIALDSTQRDAFLAILGKESNQDAMGSTLFGPHTGPADPATHSVFFKRYDGVVDQARIKQFVDRIGFEVNVSQLANGVKLDIVVGAPGTPGPSAAAVDVAAHDIFGGDKNIEDIITTGRTYDSNYVTKGGYDEAINAWKQSPQSGKPGGVGGARPAPVRVSNLARVRQAIRAAARARDREFKEWSAETRAKIQKPPRVKGAKAPPPGPVPPPQSFRPTGLPEGP
jgi:hypothetical protein